MLLFGLEGPDHCGFSEREAGITLPPEAMSAGTARPLQQAIAELHNERTDNSETGYKRTRAALGVIRECGCALAGAREWFGRRRIPKPQPGQKYLMEMRTGGSAAACPRLISVVPPGQPLCALRDSARVNSGLGRVGLYMIGRLPSNG
jgi:hypothetical protein